MRPSETAVFRLRLGDNTMHNLRSSVSILTCLAALGLTLTGCPVWSNDGSGGGSGTDGGTPPPPPPPPPPPATCDNNSSCPNGFCNSATRRCAPSTPCTTSAQCASGSYCDTRMVCVPGGCGSTADCASRGTDLICDTSAHRCIPGGQCTNNTQCASTPSTPVCLGGSCQPRTNQCQFDYQCTGSGQACVDGRCVVGCTAATAAMVCATGQVCTSNRCSYPTTTGSCGTGCPMGQLCVSNVCLATCTTDASCPSTASNRLMCDHGVCRADTRPRPFCTVDSECNRDSICYNGACRRLCPMPSVMPDGDCMRVDVQFNVCLPDTMGRSLCTSSNEVRPQCARSTDCGAGLTCVNARCQ
jgi:hypothetical protein